MANASSRPKPISLNHRERLSDVFGMLARGPSEEMAHEGGADDHLLSDKQGDELAGV